MTTRPREMGVLDAPSRNPVMVMVAGRPAERFLMAAHVCASGIQVRADASCVESLGSSLVAATQRASISPMLSRSPRDCASMAADPSLDFTSIRHSAAAADASCQMNVGAVISGGKTEPSRG